MAYIKSNKSLIDSITTSKVNVADIINNLTTNVSNKPLSAAQGVALKSLIDGLSTGKLDVTAIADWAKAATKPSYSKSEVGLGNVDNVKQYSASNPPPYPVTSVNGQTGAVAVDVPEVVQTAGQSTTDVMSQKAVTDLFNSIIDMLTIVGSVDNDNNIILSGDLADGVYTVKYENADGFTEIGTLTLGTPTVVNLLATAKTPNDITTVFNGVGYMDGKYASAAEPFYNTDANFFCTGLMKIPASGVFYIKGCTIDTSLSHTRFGLMTEDGGTINTAVLGNWGTAITLEELGEQYYSVTINWTGSAVAYYFYFSASGKGEGVVVADTPIP